MLRAARPQPFWPRPLGVLLIGLAALAVIDPDYPIPTHVQASSAARAPRLMPLRAEHPDGPTEGVPAAFTWQVDDVPPPYALVVLDEEYAELARFVDVGGTAWVPPADLRARLATGGDYHWYVEGTQGERTVQSLLAALQIR